MNIEKSKESLLKDKQCLHCKSPVSGDNEYCCLGCKSAHGLISGLGLNNFYKYLEEQVSRDKLQLNRDTKLEEVDMYEFIQEDENGGYSLNLLVEGIHCSSCVWLIEEALKKQEGVTHVRLNMSTRKLVIEWSGKKKSGNKYANLIRNMGYKATAFDPETMKTENDKEQKSLLLALAVAGFSSGNIMLMSVALWSTSQAIMGIATRDFIHLISAIIALPTVVFSGRVFFKSGFKALINKRTNMDIPISIAIILTTAISIWEGINSAEHTYFDSVTMLIFFLLIGRYLDVKSKNKARSAAGDMLKLVSNSALLVDTENGMLKNIPTSKIAIGDIIQVNSGDKFPIDGVLQDGYSTEIDTSIITGESIPREHNYGDEVFAGTVNLGDTVRLQATQLSKKSLLSEVIKLMEKAESSNSKYNDISAKAIKIYAPLVYLAGLSTFLFWYFIGEHDAKESLITAISVLIITCPCAFGLAVPTVQVLSNGRLFRNGIMLKNAEALEKLTKITHAIFDKTGTITKGKPVLQKFDDKLMNKSDVDIIISMASKSNHPYSKAIYDKFSSDVDGSHLSDVENISENAGQGLEYIDEVTGDKYRLGKVSWAVFDGSMSDASYENGKNIKADLQGVSFSKNGHEIINFRFTDEVRADANYVIDGLDEIDIKSKLISGDSVEAVKEIAIEVGFEEYVGAALPADKMQNIEDIHNQNSDNMVLMVGDGLNDAPAMAAADVSISPSSALYITQNSADIVFQGEDLSPILTAIKTAKSSVNVIKQNFAIAFAYNFIAIPVAFLGYVTPLVAAAAMSGSSILVVLNSFRVNK